MPLPLVRANSTASARNADGYGGCAFAIVDSFHDTVVPSIRVSTGSTQVQFTSSVIGLFFHGRPTTIFFAVPLFIIYAV